MSSLGMTAVESGRTCGDELGLAYFPFLRSDTTAPALRRIEEALRIVRIYLSAAGSGNCVRIDRVDGMVVQ